MFTVYQVAHVI